MKYSWLNASNNWTMHFVHPSNYTNTQGVMTVNWYLPLGSALKGSICYIYGLPNTITS